MDYEDSALDDWNDAITKSNWRRCGNCEQLTEPDELYENGSYCKICYEKIEKKYERAK